MKVIKFLAYPLLVVALWVFFATATLSGLESVDPSLRSISGAAQNAASPSETTRQDRTPRMAHGPTSQGPVHAG
jgi:hypothetical protein